MLHGELSPALRRHLLCDLKGKISIYTPTMYLIFYMGYLIWSSRQLHRVEIMTSTMGELGFEPRSIDHKAFAFPLHHAIRQEGAPFQI